MGYDVTAHRGRTNRGRDGGIDLIAVPKIRTVGSFLMAAQVKHHRGDSATGRSDVDRLLAWKDSPFRVGLMVTNASFTRDARWLADQASNKAFLRLRDFEDLKRWLRGQFTADFDSAGASQRRLLGSRHHSGSTQSPAQELAGHLAAVRNQDGRRPRHLNEPPTLDSSGSTLRQINPVMSPSNRLDERDPLTPARQTPRSRSTP